MSSFNRNYAPALVKAALERINNPELKTFLKGALELAMDGGSPSQLRHALHLHTYPVHIEEFMFGERYLRRPRDEMYPDVIDSLIDMNENRGRLVNTLTEAVLTGGIGSAKTTTALYSNAYQLYLMSCYKSPHKMFALDSTSEILFIFQSMNATLSKELDYTRFRAICEQSYYFTTVFPFDKQILSSLKFPNKIEAKPIASDGGAIGQNVVSGLIDEVNFMAIVERSKKATGGGAYDQAKAIYDSVSRRIKSRFINNGGMPGFLCLVSSKHYPGEFTDGKIEEAKTDSTIYLYDKRVWEVKPKGTYCGEWFNVFAGDETRKPKILGPDDHVDDADRHRVVAVPIEYVKSFERDMIGSLRDIAGVSTLARYPYIFNAEAVSDSFGLNPPLINVEEYDFDSELPLKIFPKRFVNPDYPRWAHVDLSISGDSTGIACGHVKGFRKTESGEMLPLIHIDFILRVNPPRGDEIKFHKVRDFLYKMRDHGLPIRWISFDGFQSVDSLQILRQKGFTTGYISMDMSLQPYELCKNAFYDGRMSLPAHKMCLKEFLSLEKIVTGKIKVDHPPSGSKDCSDAVAGVVYGLTLRREIWGQFGIPLIEIPDSIRTIQQTDGD